MIRRGWLGRLLGLGHRTRADSEAELRFHVEERVDRLVEAGWDRTEAEREVSKRFGDFEAALEAVERVERDRVRQGRVTGMWDATRRTLTLTGRTMQRSPGYAATVIGTLAVGIGAATAMFSVLHGALLRPLPYGEVDRLVRVHNRFSATGGSGPFSIPTFLDVRDQTRSLESMAGWGTGSVTLSEDAGADRLRVIWATDNLPDVLGVQPARGRGFSDGAHRAGAPREVIVTHDAWNARFAADPDILGRELRINGTPHTVVGVLPEDFWFQGDPQLMVPYEWTDDQLGDGQRGSRSQNAIGRLAPGFTPERAAEELTAITNRVGEQFPSNQVGWVVTAMPWKEFVLGGGAGAVWLLTGAVGLVLLVACVNVANLMLVRGERRTRETAVRAAIGAGRGTLMAQSIAESIALTAVAGLAGVGVAWLLVDLLVALWGDDLPRAATIGVNPTVLAAAVALTLLTGLLVGSIPALRVNMERLQQVLRGGDRGASGSAGRIQNALVMGEVALAVLLVAGAGLLVQSFRNLSSVELGVEPEGAMVFSLQLPDSYTEYEEREATFSAAVDRVARLPEVAAVGVSERTPLRGGYNITSLPSPDDPELESAFVEVRRVTPDFFAAAGIELEAGRLFEPSEYGGGSNVVVVSDEVVREIFPSGDWRGKRILRAWNEIGYEVVGVVGSVREFGIENDPRPAIYWPFGETPAPSAMTFVVRTNTAEPLDVVPDVRRVLGELEPGAPMYAVRSMDDVVLETMGNRVFTTSLFVAFGALALVLAAIGVFSVLAYLVEQRTREIGIRLALGASTQGVQRLVARRTVLLAGVGLAAGGVAAWLSGSVLQGLLYGVEANDPLVLATVLLVATGGAAAAAWLPARRAARVDPMIAMRAE